jgi:hypothetical protein
VLDEEFGVDDVAEVIPTEELIVDDEVLAVVPVVALLTKLEENLEVGVTDGVRVFVATGGGALVAAAGTGVVVSFEVVTFIFQQSL